MRILLLRLRFDFWLWAFPIAPVFLEPLLEWILPTEAEARELDDIDGVPQPPFDIPDADVH